MPFDNLPDPSIYRERLQALRAILVKQPEGREGSYETCLWSRVLANKCLSDAMRNYITASDLPPRGVQSAYTAAFFGLGEEIWSGQSKAAKLRYIDDVLATDAFLTIDIACSPLRTSDFIASIQRRALEILRGASTSDSPSRSSRRVDRGVRLAGRPHRQISTGATSRTQFDEMLMD